MFAARLSALLLVCSIVSSGCSQTPTGPSTAAAVAPTAANSQALVAIPPGLTIAPPQAVGITRFVAFGDSITWGATSAWLSAGMFFAAANGGYPERLAANLSTFHAP